MKKATALTPAREHKSFRFQVKAVDDEQGLIEAYGSVFDNVDEGDDVVCPGAFKRTIQNSKARVQAGKANFLAMMLWNHDIEHFLPIGGWYDLKEDAHGLLGKGKIILDTQLGRDVYTLIKEKVIDQFSIGYDIVGGQGEGYSYDKSTGVRNLLQLRLWEISPVAFAMNQEALLVGVKAMQTKSVCGDTSLPIGPRDASWDGSEAHNQIVKWATKSDGSIDPAKMKKVHLQVDGDADKITSYGYAFCNIENDKPIINVGGVKACAGALSGARNADAGEDKKGMQAKVSTLYERINKQYPDDPELVPPWKDDGKSRGKRMQRKTLMEHYNEEMAEDLLEDWQDVYLCALTCAVLDAFKIGDQPTQDISQALDDFKTLVLEKFVAQGVEVGLSQYLTNNSYSPADYTMQYGSDSKPDYGWMSRRAPLQGKAGRAISASNADKIQGAADNLHSMADEHMKAMKTAYKAMQDHVKAVHSAADDLATVLQGSEPTYGDGEGTPDDGQQEGKATSRTNARGTRSRSQESTVKVGYVTAAGNYVESPPGTPGVAGPLTEEEKRLGREVDEAMAALKSLRRR